jgi:hypothetical protein
MERLVAQRREAGLVMSSASSWLAAKLRTAGQTYANVNKESAENLDTQMLDR